MHGNGMNLPLQKFFSFSIPKPKVHPLTIANAIKFNLPDPIDTPGYTVFWQGESMKVLQTVDNSTEAIIVLKRGHVKIKMPTSVFHFLDEHTAEMSIRAKGIFLQRVLSELSALTGLGPEEIVRSQWWKEVRAAMWVVKLND
jgi:hypothetical protein